jgi:hypothetical protein
VNGIFISVSNRPTAGVAVLNIPGGWWRWIPGPPGRAKRRYGGASSSLRCCLPACLHAPTDDDRNTHSNITQKTQNKTTGRWSAVPLAAWLRRGHLFVSWNLDEGIRPYYLRWLLPWLTDPVPRPAPEWRRVDGTQCWSAEGGIALLTDDGAGAGNGVVRVTPHPPLDATRVMVPTAL